MSQRFTFLLQLYFISSSLGKSEGKQRQSPILTSESLREKGFKSNPSYLQGVSLRKPRNGTGKVDKQENLLFSWVREEKKVHIWVRTTKIL